MECQLFEMGTAHGLSSSRRRDLVFLIAAEPFINETGARDHLYHRRVRELIRLVGWIKGKSLKQVHVAGTWKAQKTVRTVHRWTDFGGLHKRKVQGSFLSQRWAGV